MTQEITCRNATPADAVQLSVLYQQVYIQTYGTEGVSGEFARFVQKQFAVERLESLITAYPRHLFVAVYKDNLVGVAEISGDKVCPANNRTAPELNKLYILEWFCSRGIGQLLLAAAEEELRSTGHTDIWLWVLESNSRAIAFYKKSGYQDIGRASFRMEINTYENRVMWKKL